VEGERIKRAFYALAMKHHPDLGGDPEAFRAISHAYTLLLSHLRPPSRSAGRRHHS
jgi:curved DNA-binding protein CbpA